MSVFSWMFSTVFTLVHVYVFWNLRRIIGGGPWQLLYILVVAAMGAVWYHRVFFVHNPRYMFALDVFYYWLGFILVSCVCLFAFDLLRIAFWLAGRIVDGDIARWISPSRIGPASLGLCVALFVYALYEARAVRVERLKVETDRLPPGSAGLRIVALSDIHLARLIGEKQLASMVELANREKPDMVVLLGDVVDSDMTGRDAEAALLESLGGKFGHFAVLGNHEVFSGVNHSIEFLRKAGFTVLRGEAVETGGIVVAGIDDPYTRHRFDAAEALRGVDQDKFVLLLSHRPRISEAAYGLFDLQLSGHTHGGQVFPARFLVRLLHGHSQGLSAFPAGPGGTKKSLLYLTNGAGFWGPPVRLFTPPEILVVDLLPAPGR